jgi:hypothetical protein
MSDDDDVVDGLENVVSAPILPAPVTVRRSVRQFDPVGVLLIPLMLLSKNLFEPMCLPVSDRLIQERGRMTNDEVFAAYVAP